MNVLNTPTILTLIRLILSPLILPVLFVYLLPCNNIYINILMALLFIAFSLTDFLDGYLARKYSQETALGSVLDPIADKFLVYSTLLALAVVNKLFFFWVVLLIGREFFMMGLRQVALENSFSVKVSSLGKTKTFIQMVCLTYIIFNPFQSMGYSNAWNIVELILILATVSLSLFSAGVYYKIFIKKFMQKYKEGNDH
jgi:cardiolipin synthase